MAVTPKLRFAILSRDNFTCRYCGRVAASNELQVDHKIPVAAGGNDEPKNLTTACVLCNQGKSDVEIFKKEPSLTRRKPKRRYAKGGRGGNYPIIINPEFIEGASQVHLALWDFACREDWDGAHKYLIENGYEEFAAEFGV